MFDQYIICDDSLRAVDSDTRSYEVDVRMPYYRGLGLSMVEGVDLTIDGRPVPVSSTTFSVHGNRYAMTDLSGVLDDRWEMGEPAQVGFTLEEPLAAGDHQVAAAVRLRISYMPVPGGGHDAKTLALA